MQGPDGRKGQPMSLTPVGKAIGGRDIGHPGMRLADVGAEELLKPLLPLARLGKELRGEPSRNPGRDSVRPPAAARGSVSASALPFRLSLITAFMIGRQAAGRRGRT